MLIPARFLLPLLLLAVPFPATSADASAPRFGFCHKGGGSDCVVDGDTFWIDGTKIRIADIDTPETHGPAARRRASWARARPGGSRRYSTPAPFRWSR